MPPSPLLSARMMKLRYFTTTTSVSDQKNRDRMPSTFARFGSMPCPGSKHSFIA